MRHAPWRGRPQGSATNLALGGERHGAWQHKDERRAESRHRPCEERAQQRLRHRAEPWQHDCGARLASTLASVRFRGETRRACGHGATCSGSLCHGGRQHVGCVGQRRDAARAAAATSPRPFVRDCGPGASGAACAAAPALGRFRASAAPRRKRARSASDRACVWREKGRCGEWRWRGRSWQRRRGRQQRACARGRAE